MTKTITFGGDGQYRLRDNTDGTFEIEHQPTGNTTEFTDGEIASTSIQTLDVIERLGIPIYEDDENAPDENFYFNSSDNEFRYKQEDGTISGASSDIDFQDDGQLVLSSDSVNFDNRISVTEVDGVATIDFDELDMQFIFAEEFDLLPDPEEVDDPTIAYVTELDDYLGVFQE